MNPAKKLILKKVEAQLSEKTMSDDVDSIKRKMKCPFPYWVYEPVHPNKKGNTLH